MEVAQGKKKKKDDKKDDKKKNAGVDAVAGEQAAAVPKGQLNNTLNAEAGRTTLPPPCCSQSVLALPRSPVPNENNISLNLFRFLRSILCFSNPESDRKKEFAVGLLPGTEASYAA